jgi:hypothetical protein
MRADALTGSAISRRFRLDDLLMLTGLHREFALTGPETRDSSGRLEAKQRSVQEKRSSNPHSERSRGSTSQPRRRYLADGDATATWASGRVAVTKSAALVGFEGCGGERPPPLAGGGSQQVIADAAGVTKGGISDQ